MQRLRESIHLRIKVIIAHVLLLLKPTSIVVAHLRVLPLLLGGHLLTTIVHGIVTRPW